MHFSQENMLNGVQNTFSYDKLCSKIDPTVWYFFVFSFHYNNVAHPVISDDQHFTNMWKQTSMAASCH